MKKYLALILCLLITSITQAQDEPTPYDIALERILEAERIEATSLDLSYLGLLSLPPQIGNLENLHNLYLNNNQLTELPPEVWQLINLEVLWLNNNRLITLSPKIGQLSNLVWIRLNDNQLESIPPEIGNLTNLCVLGLWNNNLQYLPTALSHVEKLKEENCLWNEWNGLDISGNPLISPPPEVVEQGTEAILDYLRNRARWHLQRLVIGIASGVGLLALIFWGLLTYRRRSNRKSKQKRDEIAR